MIDAKETAALLRQNDNYLILTHLRPDGDTVGCAAALCVALRQMGKTAYVLHNEEATPVNARYIAGLEPPENWTPDRVLAVDVAAPNMFTQSGEKWRDQVWMVIDHHSSNTGYGQYTCLDASCGACGELMYDICRDLGPITPEVALPLYVAVSTDTGCFAYGNTTARTHKVAGDLLEIDIPYRQVNKDHFRTKSAKRLQLESMLMSSTEFFQDGAVAIGALSLQDMASIQATEADAEDISAFLGQIEGVSISVTIRELKGGECKMSLRTNPTLLNAMDVCVLLGGGGHAAAAGCSVMGTIPQAREAIYQAILTVQAGQKPNG